MVQEELRRCDEEAQRREEEDEVPFGSLRLRAVCVCVCVFCRGFVLSHHTRSPTVHTFLSRLSSLQGTWTERALVHNSKEIMDGKGKSAREKEAPVFRLCRTLHRASSAALFLCSFSLAKTQTLKMPVLLLTSLRLHFGAS